MKYIFTTKSLFHKQVVNYILLKYKVDSLEMIDDARGTGFCLPVPLAIQRDGKDIVAIRLGTVTQRFDDYAKTPWELAEAFCTLLESAANNNQEFHQDLQRQ